MNTTPLKNSEVEKFRVPDMHPLSAGPGVVVQNLQDYLRAILAEHQGKLSASELKNHSIEMSGGEIYAHIHYFYGHPENDLVIVYNMDSEKIEGHYTTKSSQPMLHVHRKPNIVKGQTIDVAIPLSLDLSSVEVWLLSDDEYQKFLKREIIPFSNAFHKKGPCKFTPKEGGDWNVVVHRTGKAVDDIERVIRVNIEK